MNGQSFCGLTPSERRADLCECLVVSSTPLSKSHYSTGPWFDEAKDSHSPVPVSSCFSCDCHVTQDFSMLHWWWRQWRKPSSHPLEASCSGMCVLFSFSSGGQRSSQRQVPLVVPPTVCSWVKGDLWVKTLWILQYMQILTMFLAAPSLGDKNANKHPEILIKGKCSAKSSPISSIKAHNNHQKCPQTNLKTD